MLDACFPAFHVLAKQNLITSSLNNVIHQLTSSAAVAKSPFVVSETRKSSQIMQTKFEISAFHMNGVEALIQTPLQRASVAMMSIQAPVVGQRPYSRPFAQSSPHGGLTSASLRAPTLRQARAYPLVPASCAIRRSTICRYSNYGSSGYGPVGGDARIKVIGVGGGGGNAVNRMISSGLQVGR